MCGGRYIRWTWMLNGDFVFARAGGRGRGVWRQGWGRCWVGAAYVSAGLMLAIFCVRTRSGFWAWGWSCLVVGVGAGLLLLALARVQCWLNFLSLLARIFSFALGFWGALAAVVGVGAGLLLLTLARVIYWLIFLSLLATVRGGTSFLCPTATKKRSKENAFPQSVLSVPSVQATAFGSRVERCSQNHGHLKPSFSRILTSPRFATGALGREQEPHELVRPTRI